MARDGKLDQDLVPDFRVLRDRAPDGASSVLDAGNLLRRLGRLLPHTVERDALGEPAAVQRTA